MQRRQLRSTGGGTTHSVNKAQCVRQPWWLVCKATQPQPRTNTVHRPFSTLLLLALAAHSANAAVVQRCQGPQGHITFTHSNCPETQSWVYQRALNPSSGRKPMARKAAPRPLPVTIVKDGTRTPSAAPSRPLLKAPKKASRSKKRRTPRYLAGEQTLPIKKPKPQKAKSPQ